MTLIVKMFIAIAILKFWYLCIVKSSCLEILHQSKGFGHGWSDVTTEIHLIVKKRMWIVNFKWVDVLSNRFPQISAKVAFITLQNHCKTKLGDFLHIQCFILPTDKTINIPNYMRWKVVFVTGLLLTTLDLTELKEVLSILSSTKQWRKCDGYLATVTAMVSPANKCKRCLARHAKRWFIIRDPPRSICKFR